MCTLYHYVQYDPYNGGSGRQSLCVMLVQAWCEWGAIPTAHPPFLKTLLLEEIMSKSRAYIFERWPQLNFVNLFCYLLRGDAPFKVKLEGWMP